MTSRHISRQNRKGTCTYHPRVPAICEFPEKQFAFLNSIISMLCVSHYFSVWIKNGRNIGTIRELRHTSEMYQNGWLFPVTMKQVCKGIALSFLKILDCLLQTRRSGYRCMEYGRSHFRATSSEMSSANPLLVKQPIEASETTNFLALAS